MISKTIIVFALLVALIYFVARMRPKGNSGRLARVRKAGLLGFALLSVSLPLGIYGFFGFLFGWHRFLSPDICRVVVLQQVFESAKEMEPGIFWLWVVQQGLAFFAGFVLLRLFWFYGKGVVFSEKNITCIRVQGYCLIISNFIDLEMQGFIHASSVSLTPIICGSLIIFIAWIMDEGRKIQEEQELTV
jgi:Protein of unknown function (DUF2975)